MVALRHLCRLFVRSVLGRMLSAPASSRDALLPSATQVSFLFSPRGSRASGGSAASWLEKQLVLASPLLRQLGSVSARKAVGARYLLRPRLAPQRSPRTATLSCP